MHFRLSTHQYIDFRDRETKGLRELYRAINEYFASQQRIAERKEHEAREAVAKTKQERLAREKREAEEKARLKKEAEE